MDSTSIDLQLTIDKILENRPQTFSVFIQNKTKCVGCFMQSFCTLNDVAEAYQLSLEQLLDEIQQVK